MTTKISDKVANGMIKFLEDEDKIMNIIEMSGYSDDVCSTGIKKLTSEEKIIQIMKKRKEIVDEVNKKESPAGKSMLYFHTWRQGIRILKSDEKIIEMMELCEYFKEFTEVGVKYLQSEENIMMLMEKANDTKTYQKGIVMLTSKENILKFIEMSGYAKDVFDNGIWLLEKMADLEEITKEAKENIEDIEEEIQKFREEN
jgi:hypothetical protein